LADVATAGSGEVTLVTGEQSVCRPAWTVDRSSRCSEVPNMV
jgi:hypothetical protein